MTFFSTYCSPEVAATCQHNFVIAAAILGAIALVLSIVLIILHIANWKNGPVQFWMLIIISCLTAWTVFAFLTVAFPNPNQTAIIEVFVQSTEAVFMFAFVHMVIAFVGGWQRLKSLGDKLRPTHMLLCIPIQPNWGTLWRLLYGVWQFCFVIPAVAICIAVTTSTGNYRLGVVAGNAWLPLVIFRAASLVVLIVCLFSFYRMLAVNLQGYRLVRKFVAQKILVGILVIQNLILTGAPGRVIAPDGSQTGDLNSQIFYSQLLGVLIIIEMIAFSIVFFFTHSYKDVVGAAPLTNSESTEMA